MTITRGRQLEAENGKGRRPLTPPKTPPKKVREDSVGKVDCEDETR